MARTRKAAKGGSKIKGVVIAVLIIAVIVGLAIGGLYIKKQFIDAPAFSAETSIMYSAGNDSNWGYGNQRKEYSIDEACYVRVANAVVSDNKKGENQDVAVTYKFTGTDVTDIELMDGIAEQTDLGEPNVIEFSKTIPASSISKSKENLLIFRYNKPKKAGKVSVEVTYDDNVSDKYDAKNSISFVE